MIREKRFQVWNESHALHSLEFLREIWVLIAPCQVELDLRKFAADDGPDLLEKPYKPIAICEIEKIAEEQQIPARFEAESRRRIDQRLCLIRQNLDLQIWIHGQQILAVCF